MRVDGRGQRTTYAYDAAGRPTARRYADGTRVTQVYDAADRRVLTQNSDGRTTWLYDAAGRVAVEVGNLSRRLTYAYDAAGQRRSLSAPVTGRTTYAFDAAGRVAWLADTTGERTTFQHDAAGRRTADRLGNLTRASYTYDAADRLTRLANYDKAMAVLSSFDYRVDAVGNRTRVTEASGDRVTWSYDAAYQLRRERRSGANGYDVTHTYDPAGNRTVKAASGVRTTFAYDAADQLVSRDDATTLTNYTFDGAGNQVIEQAKAGARTTYAWDGESRMTVARVSNDAARVTFAYDGDGRRTRKSESGAFPRLYVWDGQNVLQDIVFQIGGLHTTQFALEPAFFGNLLALRDYANTPDPPRYYHFDGLGSADRLTDTSGSVTDSYINSAYGEQVTATGSTTNPYRFVGRLGYYRDTATGLYYVRARYYSSFYARFLGYDPLAIISDSLRTYIYADNCPLSRSDPSGLLSEAECNKILAEYSGPSPNDGLPPPRYPRTWIKGTVEYCTRRGCKIKIECANCAGQGQTEGFCNKGGVTSRICYNNIKTREDAIITLKHELTHAYNRCSKRFQVLQDHPCLRGACSELRATIFSGACLIPPGKPGSNRLGNESYGECVLRSATEYIGTGQQCQSHPLLGDKGAVCCAWLRCVHLDSVPPTACDLILGHGSNLIPPRPEAECIHYTEARCKFEFGDVFDVI